MALWVFRVQAGVAPTRWDAHDVSFCESEAQADTAAAGAPCRCESGRADRGGRSCGREERLERTFGRVGRVAQHRRSAHGHRFAPQPWAPVSSGSKGRETPAGIFSVIQKVEDHYSNLYDDAYMPHMQRVTWSGIALHGGVLPGRPASHGCIRLPFDFAERLFDATAMGMRVIVAPADVAPVELAHPLLFKPKQGAGAMAAVRTAEAQEAARKVAQARLASETAFRDASKAKVPVRSAEDLLRRAEAQLAAAEARLGAPIS